MEKKQKTHNNHVEHDSVGDKYGISTYIYIVSLVLCMQHVSWYGSFFVNFLNNNDNNHVCLSSISIVQTGDNGLSSHSSVCCLRNLFVTCQQCSKASSHTPFNWGVVLLLGHTHNCSLISRERGDS